MPLACSGPRIGFDATAAFSQSGGIGRYTRELLGALFQQGGGYRYRVFAGRSSQALPGQITAPPGVDAVIRRIPISPRWLYRLWYRLHLPLPVQLFTGGIDLFHSPDFVLPPVMGNIPTLLTVHDLSFEYYPDTFTPALVRYLKQVVPRSVKRATHILADSESTRRDLLQLYQTPARKITVLYSGVNNRFGPVSDDEALKAVRLKYGIGHEPYFLTVSTLQPRKNHLTLIRAFGKVAAEIEHNLVIAGGKGWLYEQIKVEVAQLGLSDRVLFTGFVQDEDLPALYSAASCFVFPSLYEGFGLPILEAMACGTPVLASDASSLPEVSGEAAILIPATDEATWATALQRIARDSDLRTNLTVAGLEQARQFSWRDSARRLLEVYERLLK